MSIFFNELVHKDNKANWEDISFLGKTEEFGIEKTKGTIILGEI